MWAMQSANQCPGLIISLSPLNPHASSVVPSIQHHVGFIDWLSCCFTLHSTQNRSFRRRLTKPVSWLGMEKLNLTQQKHTFTHQQKCTTTQNTHKKLKTGLVASYDMQPGNGEGLFWFQHFINLSVTTYPLTYSPRYMGRAHHVCNHSTCFNKETQFF